MPHLINAFRTNESLDTEPEQGQNNSADDAEIAQPESKRGAIEDRERYVKPGTNSAIQNHNDPNDNVSQYDGGQRLPPTSFALVIIIV